MLRKIVIKFRILLILGLRVIMFGFNIFELMVVLVVAIIFLGPDKLPKLIVDAVKFFKMIKKSINEAKETLDKELQISELKKEALEYKSQFEQSTQNFTKEIQLQDINAMSVDEMFKDYKDSSSESRGKSSVPALESVPETMSEAMSESKASPKTPKKAKGAKASKGVDSPLTNFEGDFGGFDEIVPSSVASSSASSLESATKSTSANSSPAQSTPKKSASKKPARTTPSPTKEALQSSAPNPQKPLADAPSSSTSTSAPSPAPSLAPSHQAKPKVGKTTSFKKKES